ncbi:Multifunctional protein ADE2 [Operophtera brumata]|uniref:Multifunctional protein ADE2 n=1 Tax=Operophtera brumata TaxID=104452 RepID=A0A0L7LFL5_OPEBR|nr:Multifunctional protein ADE2 [Operophtera brumata]
MLCLKFTSPPYFYKNEKGKDILLINDIKYRVNYGSKSVAGSKVRWRCSTHERFRCRARVHTIDNDIVKIHNVSTWKDPVKRPRLYVLRAVGIRNEDQMGVLYTQPQAVPCARAYLREPNHQDQK